MAVESKPRFHPEVARQQVRSFHLLERVVGLQPRIQPRADLIASGRADEFKETDLLPDILADSFCHLLGETLTVEFHTGRIADHPGGPYSVCTGLMRLASKGAFYNRFIRGKYK